MDYHPIQGGVEILVVNSCYKNQDKLRPVGPLGSLMQTFTFTFYTLNLVLHFNISLTSNFS